MKKDFYLRLLMVLMVLTLWSCGDDDNEDDYNTPIKEEDTTSNNGDSSGNGIDSKKEPNVTGTVDGHDYVDLGLGVLWATCNIDAFSPEESGGYYAWGETSTKSYYSYNNYSFSRLNERKDIYFINIGADISGTKYDVAKTKWGGGWRMPTKEEMKELALCSSKWMTYKGVEGCLIMGPNGNALFMPAAGVYDDSEIIEYGEEGEYWSSTNVGPNNELGFTNYPHAFVLRFSKPDRMDYWKIGYRASGSPVRAVYGKTNNGGTSSGDDDTGEAPHVIGFDFTATQTSITVKFMCNERPTSATVKYGTSSPSSTASSSISGKQVSATVSGLKAGTKYYFKCTVNNSYGSSTSDTFPAMTNY